MKCLINRLRALSRSEHSDFSIGDEAADALEELLALLVLARPHVHSGLQHDKILLRTCTAQRDSAHAAMVATKKLHDHIVDTLTDDEEVAYQLRQRYDLDELVEKIMQADEPVVFKATYTPTTAG